MIGSYKAVFFDAGGTLFHPYPSVGEIYQNTAAKYGCPAEAKNIEALFRVAWLKRDGLGSLSSHSIARPKNVGGSGKESVTEKIERDWWRSLVNEVFSQLGGIKDFDAFFDELYDIFARPEAWQVYPEVDEVLKEIKKGMQVMGIVSNWDSRLFKLCDDLDVSPYFDFILASAVFGASKPSPLIFEEALKKAGVEAKEAVHIGDSFEDDIRGAHGTGVHAILIDRHPSGREKIHEPVISSLKELL